MTHKRKVKQRTSACEVPVDDLRLHIEDHMLRYKCDMDLILGAFPESAVQYALPETPESRSAEGRAAVMRGRLWTARIWGWHLKTNFPFRRLSHLRDSSRWLSWHRNSLRHRLSHNGCQGAGSESDRKTRFLVVL